MPSHPGPWITEPPAAFSQDYNWLDFPTSSEDSLPSGVVSSMALDFAAAAEAALGPADPSALYYPVDARISAQGLVNNNAFAFPAYEDMDGNPTSVGDLLGYLLEQFALSVPLQPSILPAIREITIDVPSGAVSWQAEGGDVHDIGTFVSSDPAAEPDLAWIISDIGLSATDWIANYSGTAVGDSYHPVDGEVQYRFNTAANPMVPSSGWYGVYGDYDYLPGATLAALPLLGSDTVTAMDTTFAPAFTIDRSLLPTSGADTWMEVRAVTGAQLDHTAAPATGTPTGTMNPQDVWGLIVTPFIQNFDAPNCVYTVTFTYQRPRYRFFYASAPRLRQFPRDDSLGGAPRQARASRSVQGSARQSWTGAYR